MYNKGRQILHPAEASRLLKWCQQFSDSEAVVALPTISLLASPIVIAVRNASRAVPL